MRYGKLLVARAHARPARRRAAARGRVALAGGARGQGALGPAGVLRPALGGRDPLRGRAARRRDADRRAVRAGRQRGRARPSSADPRAAASCAAPLVSEYHGIHELRAVLVHRTRASGLRMAAAMDHVVDGPEGTVDRERELDDLARVTVSAELGHGETLTLIKFLAYGWSSQRSMASLRDQVDAALASARAHRVGRPARRPARVPRRLLGARRRRDRRRRRAPAGGALRALPRAAGRGARREARDRRQGADRATATTGTPSGTPRASCCRCSPTPRPTAVRDALCWRHSTLDLATERARQLRLDGAAFPWRTIRGQECSAYWPAGTAAFHINADIADAVLRYLHATGDDEFARGAGLELLVATARLWRSLGHHDAARRVPHRRRHRARRVLGDRRRQRLHEPHGRPEPGRRGGVVRRAIATRRRRSASTTRRSPRGATRPRAMRVPYDDELGVHEQSAGFTRPRALGLRGDDARRVPAAAALPLLRPLPQAGRQAGRPRARDGHRAAIASRARGEGARLRLLRGADGARLVAVGLRAGDRRRRGRAPRAGLRLLRRGRADGPRRPRAQHPRRPAHGVAGRLVAGRGGRASAAFATTRARSRSTRGCRRTSSAWPSGSCCAAAGCGWRSCRARRATSCVDGEPIELRHDEHAVHARARAARRRIPGARRSAGDRRRRSRRIARPLGGGRAAPADRRRGAKVARSWSAAATGPTEDRSLDPVCAGSSRPPATLGCVDGDRDRPREEGPPRVWIRRCGDRALPAHARPRRRRHLLEAGRLPLRAAAARLGHGRRRLARDGEDRRQARRPGRPQPRGHLDALRGRRRSSSSASRSSPRTPPRARCRRSTRSRSSPSSSRGASRRSRPSRASSPPPRSRPSASRATTSSRSRRGSTSSSSRARSSRPSTSRRPPSR